MSPDWKSKVGINTAVQWPAGIGAKGNEGVANNVGQTKGSIGYVEYAYAKQNKLTYTDMMNKAGKTVAPTMEAFQAAAANADWKSQPGYGVILANQPGDKSWPMTAATWILVYKKPQDPAATASALKFFAWSYAKGDKMAEAARLRADAGQRRDRHREDVVDRHPRRRRQAGLLADPLRRELSRRSGMTHSVIPKLRDGRVELPTGIFGEGAKVTEVTLNGAGMSGAEATSQGRRAEAPADHGPRLPRA